MARLACIHIAIFFSVFSLACGDGCDFPSEWRGEWRKQFDSYTGEICLQAFGQNGKEQTIHQGKENNVTVNYTCVESQVVDGYTYYVRHRSDNRDLKQCVKVYVNDFNDIMVQTASDDDVIWSCSFGQSGAASTCDMKREGADVRYVNPPPRDIDRPPDGGPNHLFADFSRNQLRISTPELDRRGYICVSFDLNLARNSGKNGVNVNDVIYKSGKVQRQLRLHFDKHLDLRPEKRDSWDTITAANMFLSSRNSRVEFEIHGLRKTVVGIDRIVIRKCSKPPADTPPKVKYRCNFDFARGSATLCGMTQTQGWEHMSLQNGYSDYKVPATPSGFFLHHGGKTQPEVSRIETPSLYYSDTEELCVSFSYLLDGCNGGDSGMRLYRSEGGGFRGEIQYGVAAFLDGDTGKKWLRHKQSITFPGLTDTWSRFGWEFSHCAFAYPWALCVGTCDIGLDDILITNGPCKLQSRVPEVTYPQDDPDRLESVSDCLTTTQYQSPVDVLVKQTQVNLARGKQSFQSSTALNSYARYAVDGNDNPSFGDGSCTHTREQYGAWWATDMGVISDVTRVVITNRLDCCSNRLANFRIGTTSTHPRSTSPSPQNYQVCNDVSGPLNAGETRSFECKSKGRYLVIQLNGKNVLTLCEVQVFGTALEINLVRGKQSFQSSTFRGYDASRAVDGNVIPLLKSAGCTHTDIQQSPWWATDMGAIKNIARVVITNRKDCCSHRLANFRIGTTNTDPRTTAPTPQNYQVCNDVSGRLNAGETRSFECKSKGRYVVIQLKGKNFLTLCEVQVFGAGRCPVFDLQPNNGGEKVYHATVKLQKEQFCDQNPSSKVTVKDHIMNIQTCKINKESSINIAEEKEAYATVAEFDAYLAVDGQAGGACYHPRKKNVWTVDLGALYSITSIKLLNRPKDLLWRRITVRVSNSTKLTDHHQCGAFVGSLQTDEERTTRGCKKAARYVSLDQVNEGLNDHNTLELCEVVVTGQKIESPVYQQSQLKCLGAVPPETVGSSREKGGVVFLSQEDPSSAAHRYYTARYKYAADNTLSLSLQRRESGRLQPNPNSDFDTDTSTGSGRGREHNYHLSLADLDTSEPQRIFHDRQESPDEASIGEGARIGLICTIAGVMVGVVIAIGVGNKAYRKRKEKETQAESKGKPSKEAIADTQA